MTSFSNGGPLLTLPAAQETVLQATTTPDTFQIPDGAEASALLPILDGTDSYPTVCAGWVHPLCWHLLDGKSLVFLYLGHMPPYQVTSQDHWPPLNPLDNSVLGPMTWAVPRPGPFAPFSLKEAVWMEKQGEKRMNRSI